MCGGSWGDGHFSGYLEKEMVNDVSGAHFQQKFSRKEMKRTVSKFSGKKNRC